MNTYPFGHCADMNFEALVRDPIQFVAELVQTSDQMPDFGLNKSISDYLAANPAAASAIPLITSAGDLQQHPPGEFVRLRCCFNTPLSDEIVLFRGQHEGRFYTAIVPCETPFNPCEIPFDRRNLVTRRMIGVSSVPSLTQWMRGEYSSSPTEASVHMKVSTDETVPVENLFEQPFSGIVKVLFDLPDRPGLVYDFYGFFDEAQAIVPSAFPKDSSIFDSSPCFTALSCTPVTVLYDPRPPAVPTSVEMRMKLMELLTSMMEPIQAELLLLWLMGRAGIRYPSFVIGLISLNFTGCTPAHASAMSMLLAFLCTALNYVKVTCGAMNEVTLRPSVVNGEYKATPMSAALNTRLVLDETELTEGEVTEKGRDNFGILTDVVQTQTFKMLFEQEMFLMEVSYPTIIFSGQSRSVISTTVAVPIGNVRPASLDMDPGLLALLRMYIEQARTTEYQLSDETASFVTAQLDAVHKSDPSITQEDLHLLMHLDRLNCISVGQSDTNEELWNHALELFAAVRALRHQK